MSKAKADLLPLPGPGDKVTVVMSSGFVTAGTVINMDQEKYIIEDVNGKTVIAFRDMVDLMIDGLPEADEDNKGV